MENLTKVISIHLHPAGNRTWASAVGGEHSRKELFEQLIGIVHLTILIRYMAAPVYGGQTHSEHISSGHQMIASCSPWIRHLNCSIPDPGPTSASENFSILTQIIVSKLSKK